MHEHARFFCCGGKFRHKMMNFGSGNEKNEPRSVFVDKNGIESRLNFSIHMFYAPKLVVYERHCKLYARKKNPMRRSSPAMR